ncbi:Storkhead-box protein 1 [Liparis tanakae]|uniref:Storkhead-box protein 1 n=1 Tax=Liparis tanakae TaxID=230148 RepID=A0A4Z2GYE9_9TELE|nr:Storkhead-box protein 1 [Liparis tanakae]
MESFLQIAPHSLAIVLSRVGAGEAVGAAGVSESDALPRHHTGYEIFADFKAENTQQHVWNQRITEAVSETFFLGWIDEHVLLIQGKEDHLEVLREGWMRRSLKPPRGFTIKYLEDQLLVCVNGALEEQSWMDGWKQKGGVSCFPMEILSFSRLLLLAKPHLSSRFLLY